NGDTTRWMSRTRDSTIGGRFSVIGGPRPGSGGTRHPPLRHRPPARAPPPRPRASSGPHAPILARLPFLALIFWAPLLIRRRPWPPAPVPPAYPAFSSVPVGISGWLLLFTIGQIATPLTIIGRSGPMFESLDNSPLWDAGGFVWFLRPLIVIERLIRMMQVALPVIGVILIVRRSRFTPRFWVAYFSVMFAYTMTDIVCGDVMADQFSLLLAPHTFAEFRAGTSRAMG